MLKLIGVGAGVARRRRGIRDSELDIAGHGELPQALTRRRSGSELRELPDATRARRTYRRHLDDHTRADKDRVLRAELEPHLARDPIN